MEYQKIINWLYNTNNQPSNFIMKTLILVNDESRGQYNIIGEIKLKNILLEQSLCNYSDVYILVKGTLTIAGVWADTATRNADKRNNYGASI